MNNAQNSAHVDHGTEEKQPHVSKDATEPRCDESATSQQINNRNSIPQSALSKKEKHLGQEMSMPKEQSPSISDVMTIEPETLDSLDVPSRSLLQRRHIQSLHVSTDFDISPKSSSLSTPLRSHHLMSPYLRGSFSETTSAKSLTVIPPDFSLATKRPLRRRHSTVLTTTKRLEENARRREIPTTKVSSAISRRAFGFEPTFGEWEKRAQTDVLKTNIRPRTQSLKFQ